LAKIFEHRGGSQIEVALDVLEETPFRSNFVDDPSAIWPQVTGVGFAPALACK